LQRQDSFYLHQVNAEKPK